MYPPGEPCICRCDSCTEAKTKRIGCIDCSEIKDACTVHSKNKAYLWLKSANTGGLSDVFCRYACKNETYIKSSNNKVKIIIGYDANSLYTSGLLDDLPCGKEQYVEISDDIVDIWIEKIVNDEIFGFVKIDAEAKSKFKYLWDQFPPFIVKEDIDVSFMGDKMKMYYEKTKRVSTQQALIAVSKYKIFKTFTPMIKFMINIGHFGI